MQNVVLDYINEHKLKKKLKEAKEWETGTGIATYCTQHNSRLVINGKPIQIGRTLEVTSDAHYKQVLLYTFIETVPKMFLLKHKSL